MAEPIDWNRRALLEHNAMQMLSLLEYPFDVRSEGAKNKLVKSAVDWAERIQAEVERRHPETKR